MSLVYTQLTSDNFNRADENPIGAPWSQLTGPNGNTAQMQLSSHLLIATATTNVNYAAKNSFVLPNDQYSEITIAGLVADGSEMGPTVRWNGTNGYRLVLVDNATSQSIAFFFSGSQTAGIANFTATVNVGDVWRISAVGTTISAFQNGVLIASATDTTSSSGVAGVLTKSDSLSNSISLWAAGSVTQAVAGGSGGWLNSHRDFVNKRGIYQ